MRLVAQSYILWVFVDIWHFGWKRSLIYRVALINTFYIKTIVKKFAHFPRKNNVCTLLTDIDTHTHLNYEHIRETVPIYIEINEIKIYANNSAV
jgi:hypothetical protein